jgi:RHS repeat-associated protein
VEQVERYYPFGQSRGHSGPGNHAYRFTGKELEASGLYYYGARYYDPVIGRFISPDSIVQAPNDPQTLNRYSYCRNNPLIYTDPSGHIFGIDDLIIGIIIGAALGAVTSAITGSDIGMGALTGAITGGFLAGAGGIVETFKLTGVVAAGAYAAAGASAGAINAGISGSDVGIGALSGGAFAAAAYALPAPKFKIFGEGPADTLANRVGSIGNRIINSSLTGAAFGGASAGMTGGDVLEGMAMGAAGWAAGSAGNMLIGHAIGFVGSGFEAPTFKDGVFIYGGNRGGHLTIGNVVWEHPSGMSPSEFIHEQSGHGTFQANLLGPAYLPAHILDKMTFSLTLEYSQPMLGGAPTYYDLYPPQDRPWTWWSIFK